MHKLDKTKITLLSSALLLLAIVLKYIGINDMYRNVLLIVASIISGYSIIKRAIGALRYRILGIDALVTIALIGALIIGEYTEAAAVTFLFTLGALLEERALKKTRSTLKELLNLAPKKAVILRDNMEIQVSPEDIKEGEIVIVRAGEKIPVDGSIINGHGLLNESAITGEPVPLFKKENGFVYSGTVMEQGYIRIKVEKVGEDTTLSRILYMVEEAQENKSKVQRMLEVFGKYYTPMVVILALVVYVLFRDIVMSLTLLVIACPGALIISVPVSTIAAIGNAAKNGILIKSGAALESMSKVKVAAFDKTGTLTFGKPQVTGIFSPELEEKELLTYAAVAELQSEHPLAGAILEAAKALDLDTTETAEKFEGVTGQGISAVVRGKHIYIGNRGFLSEKNIYIPYNVEQYLYEKQSNGETVVLISDDEKAIGAIAIADTIREDAHELIKHLKNQGIKNIIMLTGDSKATAEAIGQKLGIEEIYSDCLPGDKISIIKKLQTEGKKVAMIGDGINDAPALTQADVGIAVGGPGKDLASEVSDVVLISGELNKVGYIFSLSHAAVRNMKQNIAFAMTVVILLIGGTLTKQVFLASGMFIHELSIILVILNSYGLLKYRKSQVYLKHLKNKERKSVYEA